MPRHLVAWRSGGVGDGLDDLAIPHHLVVALVVCADAPHPVAWGRAIEEDATGVDALVVVERAQGGAVAGLILRDCSCSAFSPHGVKPVDSRDF